MKALCVDDEFWMLKSLVEAVEQSTDIESAHGFDNADDALSWAGENRVDAAFLDIQLQDGSGLELARRLTELNPEVYIIFCTGYREYALDAYKIHASGYLTKPVTAEDIQKELDCILRRRRNMRLLTVRCFGAFEAYVQDRPLALKRTKSKELLAYLVDRQGAEVTAKEICSVIWGEDTDERKNMAYLRQLFADLRSALRSVGAESVLLSSSTGYALNTELIDCDYYRFLKGEADARRLFTGEYMFRYSWAEPTGAWLTNKLNKKVE